MYLMYTLEKLLLRRQRINCIWAKYVVIACTQILGSHQRSKRVPTATEVPRLRKLIIIVLCSWYRAHILLNIRHRQACQNLLIVVLQTKTANFRNLIKKNLVRIASSHLAATRGKDIRVGSVKDLPRLCLILSKKFRNRGAKQLSCPVEKKQTHLGSFKLRHSDLWSSCCLVSMAGM